MENSNSVFMFTSVHCSFNSNDECVVRLNGNLSLSACTEMIKAINVFSNRREQPGTTDIPGKSIIILYHYLHV